MNTNPNAPELFPFAGQVIVSTSGGSGTQVIQIDNDRDFEVVAIDVQIYDDANGLLDRRRLDMDNFNISLSTKNSGKNWQNVAVDVQSLATLNEMLRLQKRVIPRNSQVNVSVSHSVVSASAQNTAPFTVNVTLIGFKIN